MFFLERKAAPARRNQRTFVYQRRLFDDMSSMPQMRRHKAFLLLFFKNETPLS
jgi:hypothetical protein